MFRFTIRELVLLTLVVGSLTGWGVDHWRLSRTARDYKDGMDIREMCLDMYCPQWESNGQGLR
jgi:hypothetical protein